MKTYAVHIEQVELPTEVPILVQYYIVPEVLPAPRTSTNPMGTDDGAPAECIILSARDMNGQPYDLSEHEYEFVSMNLLERSEA